MNKQKSFLIVLLLLATTTFMMFSNPVVAANNEIYVDVEYSAVFPWDDDDRLYDYPLDWDFNDSVLSIENYWKIDEDEIWRLPNTRLIVYLPESQKVRLDPDLREISTISEENSHWPEWYYSKDLVMHLGELSAVADE